MEARTGGALSAADRCYVTERPCRNQHERLGFECRILMGSYNTLEYQTQSEHAGRHWCTLDGHQPTSFSLGLGTRGVSTLASPDAPCSGSIPAPGRAVLCCEWSQTLCRRKPPGMNPQECESKSSGKGNGFSPKPSCLS